MRVGDKYCRVRTFACVDYDLGRQLLNSALPFGSGFFFGSPHKLVRAYFFDLFLILSVEYLILRITLFYQLRAGPRVVGLASE